MTAAERTFVTRCSLAVRPFDLWTGQPPGNSALAVRLEETGKRPVRASDGSYAFLDFPGSVCTLTIDSPFYLPTRMTVHLEEFAGRVPIVTAGLRPNRAYPPPAAASGFRFRVAGPSGAPEAGAIVTAYVEHDGAARGRLAEDKAAAGARRIAVAAGNGRLQPGDAFVLKGKGGSDAEWSAVADTWDAGLALQLEQPLSKGWPRGTVLLPACRTWSDMDGSVVIPFRGSFPPAAEAVVEIVSGERRWAARWQMEAGSVANMPDVRLD
ncbi:hypothetical protein [Cohnella caldifontis]|uniref:hypothetical protein n=1 Tax=Cohnella caldifontis TaxID=3027471 RepID=UPI0023EC1FDB|nr:hypothetical protein [Cohnella sp. YIM B05605]